MLLRLLLIAGFFFSLDQFIKMLVGRHLAKGQSASVASWIRPRWVTNEQGAQLPRNPRLQLLLLTAILCSVYLLTRHGYFFQHPAAQLGLGMALGGAGSNVYDQLRHGAVMDFLDLGRWPAFNIADVAITIGVTIALWFL